MDSNKIKVILLLVLAAFAALYLGVSAATAQVEAVLWVVIAGTVTMCLMMGRRIYLLYPFMSALGLALPIPGNFSTELIAQAIILGFSAILFLMRKIPLRPAFTELEFWCLMAIFAVVQVYMRNPVGLNIFGGGMVGGKPYVLLAISVMAYYLISMLVVPPSELKWWVRLTMWGSWINFGLGAVAKFVPSIGRYLGASFSTDVAQQDNGKNEAIDEGAAGRVTFVRTISLNLANWISSKVPPLRAMFHPVWAILIFSTLAAAAVSGYRSQLATVCATYIVGTYYRGGLRSLLVAGFLGAMAIVLLALTNLIAPLPPNVQRALTFLPGTWEERYKRDSEQSSEWRMEMWKEVLTSERYIKNKWLGDGLGFSSEQLQQMAALQDSTATGIGGWDAHRESAMIAGDYHSGPVQTIRTIGYVGLLILLIGLFRVSVHAHRQIERCRNTEWFGTALFFGNTWIWMPVSWVFVFGSFTGGVAGLLLGTAMTRLLENNLPLPPYVVRRREPYILKRQSAGQARP